MNWSDYGKGIPKGAWNSISDFTNWATGERFGLPEFEAASPDEMEGMRSGAGILATLGFRAAKTGTVASRGPYAGSIRNVNPTKGTANCGNCVVATDATLAGRPASALPGGPTQLRDLEVAFSNANFRAKFGSLTTIDSISKTMLSAGPGARGVVFGSRGSGRVGHVFNVVNQAGTVRYLDGQTGKPATFGG